MYNMYIHIWYTRICIYVGCMASGRIMGKKVQLRQASPITVVTDVFHNSIGCCILYMYIWWLM